MRPPCHEEKEGGDGSPVCIPLQKWEERGLWYFRWVRRVFRRVYIYKYIREGEAPEKQGALLFCSFSVLFCFFILFLKPALSLFLLHLFFSSYFYPLMYKLCVCVLVVTVVPRARPPTDALPEIKRSTSGQRAKPSGQKGKNCYKGTCAVYVCYDVSLFASFLPSLCTSPNCSVPVVFRITMTTISTVTHYST